jgi:hypothetical protein
MNWEVKKLSREGATKVAKVKVIVTDAVADTQESLQEMPICQPSELPRIPHTLELQDICQVGAKRPGQNHIGHQDVLLLLVAQS